MPDRSTPAYRLRQRLGQFPTPPELARLLAAQLPTDTPLAVDLAAGDGVLLDAMRRRSNGCRLVGVDINPVAIQKGRACDPSIEIALGNGLLVPLPRLRMPGMATIANPPFGEGGDEALGRTLLSQAFPDVESGFGLRRLEMQFLARYLTWARKVNGKISILLPCGFADGDMYRKFRASIMSRFGLLRVIEIPPSSFACTEARCALLVVDAALTSTQAVEICRYDSASRSIEGVYTGWVEPGERLDARYHAGKSLVDSRTPRLKDIGVEVARGSFSNCEARRQQVDAIHTTQLATARDGSLRLRSAAGYPDDAVMASAGDILLPRTGTRVAWRAAMVSRGAAPITDHVFRIRAPHSVRSAVRESFRSPLFERWLESVSKGVCATVLTKRELLEMPAFALA